MLSSHYTSAFTVSRATLVGRIKSFAVIGTSRGHIQPATSEYQLQSAGAYNKSYILLTDYAVQIGDIITIGADEYKVHGVQSHSFRVGQRHVEVFCHKD